MISEETIIMRIYKDAQTLNSVQILNKYRGVLQDYVFDVLKERNNFFKDLPGGDRSEMLIPILEDICGIFFIETKLLTAKTREREVVVIRQMFVFVARILKAGSYKQIATLLGGRDHSTAMHSEKTFKNLLTTRNQYALFLWSQWMEYGNPEFTRFFKWVNTDPLQDTEPDKEERPAAVYTNIPVYNYAS